MEEKTSVSFLDSVATDSGRFFGQSTHGIDYSPFIYPINLPTPSPTVHLPQSRPLSIGYMASPLMKPILFRVLAPPEDGATGCV